MANSVGIRLNDIEEERVLGAMLAAGDENVSTHVKRYYFATLDRLDHYNQIKSELDLVRHELRELREQQAHAAENTDSSSTALVEAITQQQDLLLTLVSGIYRMLRQAVPPRIQHDADKVINIDAIEEYLKPEPHDDNATMSGAASPDSSARQADLGQPRAMYSATKELNPYALGKRRVREEMARREAESKRDMQKTWPEDEALTAKQTNVATPVNQKPTFAQKLKQSFTR